MAPFANHEFTHRHLVNSLSSQNAGFNICKFKDKRFFNSDADPHFHVIISLENNLSVVICLITSQIEKRAAYYQKIGERTDDENILEALIPVDNSDFECLEKKSIINCHSAECLTVNELYDRIDFTHPIKIKFEPKGANEYFSLEQKKAIINGIINSKIVRDITKQEIRRLPIAL